jgi:Ca2+-binding EF-hand superfamily protein
MGIVNAEDIIANLDVSGDLVVSYTEFLAACVFRSSSQLRRELWEVFQIFDENHDGTISVRELTDILAGDHPVASRLADGTTPEEVMQELDTSGDGLISWEEFSNFCLTKLGVAEAPK